jgi:hypothetical protein
MKVKIDPITIDKHTMTQIILKQDSWQYNRRVADQIVYADDNFKLVPSMEHEHRNGEPCEPHLRTAVFGAKDEGKLLAFLDMPYAVWETLAGKEVATC